MTHVQPLLLTYYGDDFTGSTDVMEILQWGGVPTVLFLEPPSPDILREQFPGARAVGVAGVSRSMSPTQMDQALPPIFKALQILGAPLVHYKICSTFDSSPTMGSIGHAAEIGMQVFGEQSIPLIVGAPFLRRYVAFSNLFARVDDVTYRLDRHPTMSKHPLTPMNEADLRLHLAQQTHRSIAAFTLYHLSQPEETRRDLFERLQAEGSGFIVFDTIDDEHLHAIGALIDEMCAQRTTDYPLFVVGSSGVQKALALYWRMNGVIASDPEPPAPVGAVDQLIVVSGSAAPATADQIRWAEAHGFTLIRLDSVALIDPAEADQVREQVIAQALETLSRGASIVLYSAYGPDDPHITQTKARMAQLALDPATVGQRLGSQQGMILRALLEKSSLRRAVVTGGDTCGYAARQLGIYALTAMMPIAPGAPLCKAYSADPAFSGLEISLKAGQVGKQDYFASILHGSL